MDDQKNNHRCLLACREPAIMLICGGLTSCSTFRNRFFVKAHHYLSFSVKHAVCGWRMRERWVPGSSFSPMH